MSQSPGPPVLQRLCCFLLLTLLVQAPGFAQSKPGVSIGDTSGPQATDQSLQAPAAGVAASQAAPDAPIRDLQPVVVTGVQPGPGLWKVSRDGHVLWIIGTLSPMPRAIQWDTHAVEQVIAQSQQVLEAPGVKLKADTGWLGKLALIPTALKARRNPDGKTLQEVVPADQYARWQVLKQRYLGNDRGIEQWRPVFAALELYDKAIRKNGMRHGGIAPVVEKLARRHKLEITPVQVVISIQQPKQALREFAQTRLDDNACFARTLDRIEGDLDTMVLRANAWSIGDLQTLGELPYRNQYAACSAAFGAATIAHKYGIDDIPGQLRRAWLEHAEAALARNRGTLAILPITELLKQDGYLAALRAKGYLVEEP